MAVRTISVSLPYDQVLVDTATQFNRACQMVLDYGSSHGTIRKLHLNAATYKPIRKELPSLLPIRECI